MNVLSKPVRRVIGLVAAMMSVLLVAAPSQAANYTWKGPGRIWEDPANWTPNGIPGAGDYAIIGENVSIVLTNNVTLNRLVAGAGVRLSGSGDLSITGSAALTDVLIGGTGVLRVEAGAGLRIETAGYSYGAIPYIRGVQNLSGNVNTRFDRQVLNFGSINWNGGNILLSSTLENTKGAIIRFRSGKALVIDGTSPAVVNNAGTIFNTVADDTKINVPFNSSGILNSMAGTFYFLNTFQQTGGETQLNGGGVYSRKEMSYDGGRFDGKGTVQGSILNEGAVFAPGHSPGAVVINGNYTQTRGGTLQMELGGLAAGTQYDQLVVNGTATLDGTLEIAQYNGYVPVAGNSFELLKYVVCTGNFATLVNSYASPGIYFTTTKTPDYLVAQPISDVAKPAVTVTVPINDTGYGSLIQAKGTASDVGSGLSSVKIKLFRYAAAGVVAGYWNGSTWDAVYSVKDDLPATGTTSWSWAMPALAAGKYDLTATARDKANNSTASTKIVFWIDTTLPDVPVFTTPTSGAGITNLNLIKGTASDSGSGIKRVDLRIKKVSDVTYWNGSAWVAGSVYISTVLKGSEWSVANGVGTTLPSGALLPDGSYQLTALAVDKAELKKALTITVTVKAAVVAVQAGNSTLEEPSK